MIRDPWKRVTNRDTPPPPALAVTNHESRTTHHVPSKSFHRTDRISAQLRRELGTIVHAAVREHGLPSVSVSDAEVTRDLAHAKVFVTALQPERSKEAVKALNELARELRYELGRAMKLRHVPELHFQYDDSVDRGERIGNLLRDNPSTEQTGDNATE